MWSQLLCTKRTHLNSIKTYEMICQIIFWILSSATTPPKTMKLEKKEPLLLAPMKKLDATTHAHVVPAKNTNIAAANKTWNTS